MEKRSLQFHLPVIILREKKRFVAYSPALDLSTSGKTLATARKNFAEVAVLFLEEIIENNTTAEVLEGLGWQKKDSQWESPIIVVNQSETVKIPIAV